MATLEEIRDDELAELLGEPVPDRGSGCGSGHGRETGAATAVKAAPTLDELEDLTTRFADLHKGMRQRDASWLKAMGVTVGGSELAALMGLNPYSDFKEVVLSKIATLEGGSRWDGGGEACWWGILFEDVIGAFVEIDLGSQVRGDEICIQIIAGHRNSPDGYLVARFYQGQDARLHLWTTDMGRDVPTIPMIAMLEFKCPLTRKPKGNVPPHYLPQVWSGLAVSPVAHRGLFVDAVFRKCGLLDLGDTPAYDTAYHSRDKEAWGNPVAWGLIGVYAPLLSAPRHVRLGWRGPEWAPGDPSPDDPDADAAQAAWQIHSKYFGLKLTSQAATRDVADFGDMEARLFNQALGLINRGRFHVDRVAPCFADGRGQALHTGREVGDTIEALRLAPADGYWLVGVLPWKLFEVDYVPVDRRPGFLQEVLPLIQKVHQTVAEAQASGDPAAFLKARDGPARPGRSTLVSEGNIQDLFDGLEPPGAQK